MPLKLVPPRIGKTPFYTVRGTHHGVYVERSTKATSRAQAAAMLKRWKEGIERDAVSRPGEPTFLDAAVSYMADTGNDRFVSRIIDRIGHLALPKVTQQVVTDLSVSVYPKASPATRNRQCHTVVSAILKHAGVEWKMKRPKGWRGLERTDFYLPEQAFLIFEAADEVDLEFGIFLRFLTYTGARLKEATVRFQCKTLSLDDQLGYIEQGKNKLPRAVFLPPVLVAALANHPRGLDRPDETVFRFRKNGHLYKLLHPIQKALKGRVEVKAFHIFCHTYGAWMTRYGGLDTSRLLLTERWKSPASARRYQHLVASEEAQKAALLPVPKSKKQRG